MTKYLSAVLSEDDNEALRRFHDHYRGLAIPDTPENEMLLAAVHAAGKVVDTAVALPAAPVEPAETNYALVLIPVPPEELAGNAAQHPVERAAYTRMRVRHELTDALGDGVEVLAVTKFRDPAVALGLGAVNLQQSAPWLLGDFVATARRVAERFGTVLANAEFEVRPELAAMINRVVNVRVDDITGAGFEELLRRHEELKKRVEDLEETIDAEANAHESSAADLRRVLPSAYRRHR